VDYLCRKQNFLAVYKFIAKPIFFLLPPERAHHATLAIFRFALSIPGLGALIRAYFRVTDPRLVRRELGLEFPNPIGLAAGFDKDGRYLHVMQALGFGFIEVGTVTPRPQAGNPQPRLFRLPADEALINRMGFNNGGVDALVERLKKRPRGLIVGGNIGKNKDTPNDEALNDYRDCFEKLHPWVDYFVVNVSSPNTPGLRELQEKEPLQQLLGALETINRSQTVQRPILLKIAPDLNEAQLNDIVDIVQQTGIAGIIASNTTIARAGLKTPETRLDAIGAGGLSGKPVQEASTRVLRYLYERSGGKLFLIGVGGIHNAASAREKLDAGARLVQVYSGLVYEGPALVKRINQNFLHKKF
jgi:dihydroorotate dehydrogenase